MILKMMPALLVALALAVPAAAEDVCYTTSVSDEETLIVTLPFGYWSGDTDGTSYFVNDVCQDDPPGEDDGDPYTSDGGPCLFSFWFYEETNGIPGLQRGDSVRWDTRDCNFSVDSDWFLW